MSDFNVYAVYYTAATGTYEAGYVWNNILVQSGGSVPVISGSSLVEDTDRKYPIGSIYTVTS